MEKGHLFYVFILEVIMEQRPDESFGFEFRTEARCEIIRESLRRSQSLQVPRRWMDHVLACPMRTRAQTLPLVSRCYQVY